MTLMASKIIADALKTSKGRSRLAEAMMAPLRHRRNYTGIAQRAFSIMHYCVVCDKLIKAFKLYDENFYRLGKEPAPVSALYMKVCSKCVKKTKERLSLVSELDISEMPLYINDENVFVRTHAEKRLKKGK